LLGYRSDRYAEGTPHPDSLEKGAWQRLGLDFFRQDTGARSNYRVDERASMLKDAKMNLDELRAAQAPLKARYRTEPSAALVIQTATGTLDASAQVCNVETHLGTLQAGLHPATGGDGTKACAGDMLLQALVACAGVTLSAVATAMGITVRAGRIRAEGEIDFRGTLGVSRETPVGFQSVRLCLDIDTDAEPDAQKKLIELTERYCVVYQTLRKPPVISTLESPDLHPRSQG